MADGIIVFAGPSLPPSADRPAGMQFRAPARRGDVYRALRDRPRTIVLIDGEFHGSPAVWHRELLDAIDEGVTVVGAGSMGALRAAELHGLGMIGCGRIFEAFRDGVLNDDDEVALVYGPAHLGYPALSEPMVNLRATLSLARSVGLVDDAREHEALIHAKALHFTRRSHAAVLAAPPFADDSELRARYADFAATRAVDQKRADALEAIRMASTLPDAARRCMRARRSLSEGQWAPARVAMELDLGTFVPPAPPELLASCGLPPSDEARWRAELSWRWFARQTLVGEQPCEIPEPLALGRDPPPGSGLTAAGFACLTRELAAAGRALALVVPSMAADAPAVRIQRRLAGCGSGAKAEKDADPVIVCARRRIVADWAQSRGLAPPEHECRVSIRRLEATLGGDRSAILAGLEISEPVYLTALSERIRSDWVIERGPGFFGYASWSFPVALFRELQRLGAVAPLLSRGAT